MKRIQIVLALILALLCGSEARAEDAKLTLKLAHWLPQSHPLHQSLLQWADSISKETGGSLAITIFPSEQLGKAFDGYDLARDGIADVALVSPGYQPGRFPISAAGELPFLISDAKAGSIAFDSWYRSFAAAEMKDVHYCTGMLRAAAFFHSRTRPIAVPADIKGLRVRPPDGTMANFVTLLGGTNVQASAPASRDLLEKGVADATIFPWGSTILFGVDKVVKFHLDVPVEMGVFVVVMTKQRYASLSDAQRKVVDSHCTTEWGTRLATPWAEFEDAGAAKIAAEPGHQVLKATPDQIQSWRSAAQPLVSEWGNAVRKAGSDPDKIMKEFTAKLEQYRAKF
jgi:TRAP-type C4-dicarboxylate transport system substrate-binding protein